MITKSGLLVLNQSHYYYESSQNKTFLLVGFCEKENEINSGRTRDTRPMDGLGEFRNSMS